MLCRTQCHAHALPASARRSCSMCGSILSLDLWIWAHFSLCWWGPVAGGSRPLANMEVSFHRLLAGLNCLLQIIHNFQSVAPCVHPRYTVSPKIVSPCAPRWSFLHSFGKKTTQWCFWRFYWDQTCLVFTHICYSWCCWNRASHSHSARAIMFGIESSDRSSLHAYNLFLIYQGSKE